MFLCQQVGHENQRIEWLCSGMDIGAEGCSQSSGLCRLGVLQAAIIVEEDYRSLSLLSFALLSGGVVFILRNWAKFKLDEDNCVYF